MKYSIIVPVHNAESTITRCVESVVVKMLIYK